MKTLQCINQNLEKTGNTHLLHWGLVKNKLFCIMYMVQKMLFRTVNW